MRYGLIFSFFLSVFCLGITQSATAYFYGAVTMYNPEKKQTVILLSDIHEPDQEITFTQQKALIELLDAIKKRASLFFIVEDLANLSYQQDGKRRAFNTPLCYSATIPEMLEVSYVNVEFRYEPDSHLIEETVEKYAHSSFLSDVEQYYSANQNSNELWYKYNKYIDVAILENINKQKENYIVVAAGGFHCALVAKELYKSGYTQVKVITDPAIKMLYAYTTTNCPALSEFQYKPKPLILNKNMLIPGLFILNKDMLIPELSFFNHMQYTLKSYMQRHALPLLVGGAACITGIYCYRNGIRASDLLYTTYGTIKNIFARYKKF